MLEYSTYDNCTHNYIKGTEKQYSKKNDGSCVTEFYYSKVCTLCGNRVTESNAYSSQSYKICPRRHK